jgi:hypothetical protein
MNFKGQTEDSREIYKKALETCMSLHRDPAGEPGEEFFYRGL